MTIDLETVRRDTPGCEDVLHFNNAGASLPPRCVTDAQKDHLDLEATMGGYEAHAARRVEADRLYGAAAQLIGAKPTEIACVENATVAWCMAFYGLATTFKPGDRILTAEAEYAANYVAYLQAAKRTGCVVEIIPNDESGALSVPALEGMMDDRVALISITHVPTNGGLVNPAADVGRVARAADVPYLLDACQSVGQLSVDVDEIGCDFLSATGRKYIRGPRGTGFLYAREDMLDRFEPPMIDHSAAHWTAMDTYELLPDAKRFENWEFNIAARIGLGVALDYALDLGIDEIERRVRVLADRLRGGLSSLSKVTVRDLGTDPCGIVTFTHEHLPPAEVKAKMAERGVNVSVSNQRSTLADMQARGLTELVRASVHYYNSEAEVDRFLEATEDLK